MSLKKILFLVNWCFSDSCFIRKYSRRKYKPGLSWSWSCFYQCNHFFAPLKSNKNLLDARRSGSNVPSRSWSLSVTNADHSWLFAWTYLNAIRMFNERIPRFMSHFDKPENSETVMKSSETIGNVGLQRSSWTRWTVLKFCKIMFTFTLSKSK